MPREVDVGERVGKYLILDKLNSGGMATAYKARDSRGDTVFLKQYHSPTFIMPWYRGYMAYQEKMKRRIAESPFRNFSYRMIEYFEFNARPKCYFQAIEFVDASQSLENRLRHAADRTKPLTWSQRLTMAKVTMGAIKMLHQAKIVHSDLKPANIILIDNPDSRMGYTLKVIDLDFSLLSDQKAPWHDQPDQGYFGTPGYISPEHFSGDVPQHASDVFTCGIILYQLLSEQGHPYLDGESYVSDVQAHRAPPPDLLGDTGDDRLQDLMHRSLSPKMADRPTAKELHEELIRDTGRPADDAEHPAPSKPAPAPSAPDRKSTSARLVLQSESGTEASFGVDSELGARVASQFGSDARFFSEPQFRLEKKGDSWFVVPANTATNQTMLNGKAIETRQPLNAGDVLAVGNESTGITKLPLTVSFE